MTDASSTAAPPSQDTGGSQAADQVREKAQVAQEKVKEGAQQASGRLREQVDQRSTQAGEQVADSAQALRQTGESLREQGKDGPAKAADRAADQAEKLGSYLRDSSADRILGDVEDFGRRQPLAAAAAGITLGFAAARFLKASSQERFQARGGYGGSAYGSSGALPRRTGGYDDVAAGTYGAGSTAGDPVASPRERPAGL